MVANKKPRLEVRAVGVSPKLKKAISLSAKKNLRTESQELIWQLNQIYGIK